MKRRVGGAFLSSPGLALGAAFRAMHVMPQLAGAPVLRENPRTLRERRPVPDMLPVPAE